MNDMIIAWLVAQGIIFVLFVGFLWLIMRDQKKDHCLRSKEREWRQARLEAFMKRIPRP